MFETIFEGYTILIGENKKENDILVKTSDPDDYWIHISGYSSPHGIIKNPNKERIDIKPIKRTCLLIKSRSTKCKSMKNVIFDVARIKNVIPTDIEGQVTITEFCKKITI
jgi:predicted ribosome quality control (RQC) complex YloA/Tae2 family protein